MQKQKSSFHISAIISFTEHNAEVFQIRMNLLKNIAKNFGFKIMIDTFAPAFGAKS